MRKSGWTPSIVPHDDQDVYLVVDDLGRLGRVWREADYEKTDLETIVQDLLDSQYNNPIGVFGFNAVEGRARDVSGDVARELRLRCDLNLRDLPDIIKVFVERHEGDRRTHPQADLKEFGRRAWSPNAAIAPTAAAGRRTGSR